MNIIRNKLLLNIRLSLPETFPFHLKKCIHQGITHPADFKLYSELSYKFIDKFTLSQAASVLHSFSIPIYRNFQIFTTLTNRIRSILKECPPSLEDSIKIINSCGRLHYSDSQLFPHLLDVVRSNIESVKTKNIVSILHSLTKLRYEDFELLAHFSLVAAGKLDEISDIALANFSITCSKIYTGEDTPNTQHLDIGRKIHGTILAEIKGRCSSSSPLDNFRHVMALSNMKHLVENVDQLSDCLDHLFKFISCPVLYYEHLIILFECMISLDYINRNYINNNLVPSLLNKRRDNNSTQQNDLRLLRCLSTVPNLSRSSEFLTDQILENLSDNVSKNPRLIKYTFNLINSVDANPVAFLSNLQKHLEKSTLKLDGDEIKEIKESIQRSDENWDHLDSLLESSM